MNKSIYIYIFMSGKSGLRCRGLNKLLIMEHEMAR